MNFYSTFALSGGLAFFLFGMHVMSQSLEKIAGGKLESTLRKLTSNPLNGLALGMGVTMAVQSSSAITVMLVGLVNSGIMSLEQSVGVIMGSNIGTTITAWLISTIGIKGDNIFLLLLKPDNFAPVMALVGVCMIMMSKSKKRRDIGTILIGFAVLIYGMRLMKDAVSPLVRTEGFSKMLTAFENPLLSVLAGALFTAVIQSSSASVGILQALALTGAISYQLAIPIIMGQNIGTCVTALISSIEVNKSAKRVAAVHVAFNVIGATAGLAAFCCVTSFTDLDLASKPIGVVGIASVHTIFNLITTALLLPFSNQLVKLAKLIVPDAKEEETAVLLDVRLLATPPLAVSQCRERVKEMASLALEALTEALGAFADRTAEAASAVREKERKLDDMEDQISTFLLGLSSYDLTDADSHVVTELLHTISDFERIGDHAVNITEIALEMWENKQNFSSKAQSDFSTLFSALEEISNITVRAFDANDTNLAAKVEPLEEVIDDLTATIRDKHIARLRGGECSPELGVYLTDLLINCERVSDHCSNIAVSVIQLSATNLFSHVYLTRLKADGDPNFVENYNAFGMKYKLS